MPTPTKSQVTPNFVGVDTPQSKHLTPGFSQVPTAAGRGETVSTVCRSWLDGTKVKTVETVFNIVSSREFTPLKRGVNHAQLSEFTPLTRGVGHPGSSRTESVKRGVKKSRSRDSRSAIPSDC
jgi:hypothetical protein